MTDELKKKIEEIAKAFREAGMSDIPHRVRDANTVYLYLRESARTTYLGTYLNTFSVLDGKVEPCPLWSNETAVERAEVVISPVYRHNGTAEDTSIGIWFYPRHATIHAHPGRYGYEIENNPAYVAYVKKHSPFDYLAHPETLVFVGGGCVGERTAKLPKTAGRTAVANAVRKTMALVMAFVPKDHSKWARDPKDYHVDTTNAHNEYMARIRAAPAAAVREDEDEDENGKTGE